MNQHNLENLVVELANRVRHRYYGKYGGIVVDDQDPENRGRLRVQVPDVMSDVDSSWARPCVPYAGASVGLWHIPPVGAAVWVEFEKGELDLPIWTGCWWGKDERPSDETGKDADPSLKLLRTQEGLTVALDDDQKTIAVSDRNGDNLLKITATAGELRVQASTRLIVEAPKIELVENSTHPLVFGDDLLQYLTQLYSIFIAHTHPGETVLGIPVTPAPPLPPFPAPQPSMLSTKVTTG